MIVNIVINGIHDHADHIKINDHLYFYKSRQLSFRGATMSFLQNNIQIYFDKKIGKKSKIVYFRKTPDLLNKGC